MEQRRLASAAKDQEARRLWTTATELCRRRKTLRLLRAADHPAPDRERSNASQRLYESPFTDEAPLGPDALFPSADVDNIITILKTVHAHASPETTVA